MNFKMRGRSMPHTQGPHIFLADDYFTVHVITTVRFMVQGKYVHGTNEPKKW